MVHFGLHLSPSKAPKGQEAPHPVGAEGSPGRGAWGGGPGAPVCGSHLPKAVPERTLHTARTSALMNPTSANFRSRWLDADFCSRNSDGPLLSLLELSLARLFLTGDTAALQTWPGRQCPGAGPARPREPCPSSRQPGLGGGGAPLARGAPVPR